MIGACSALGDEGLVQGVLGAVDCQTRNFAEAGYSALTQSSSSFQLALTGLLTLYVALVGYRMLFAAGGARLSDAPGIALRIGAILALVTSWPTFQTLVFDMAARAPVEIAGIVAAPAQADQTSLAANPVDGLQTAYDQLAASAAAFGKIAGPVAKGYSSPEAAAAETLSLASGVLFMTTAGVIAAATLAVGVLTAVGPVFIALFLMPATRGLFSGWLRSLAAAALVLMLGWLGITLLLSVLDPWIRLLAEQLDAKRMLPQTATSAASLVFVFGVGQAALVVGACVTAFGFRMPQLNAASGARRSTTLPAAEAAAAPEASRAQRLAFDLQRDRISAAAAGGAAHFTQQATSRTSNVSRTLGAAPAQGAPRLGETYRRPTIQGRGGRRR